MGGRRERGGGGEIENHREGRLIDRPERARGWVRTRACQCVRARVCREGLRGDVLRMRTGSCLRRRRRLGVGSTPEGGRGFRLPCCHSHLRGRRLCSGFSAGGAGSARRRARLCWARRGLKVPGARRPRRPRRRESQSGGWQPASESQAGWPPLGRGPREEQWVREAPPEPRAGGRPWFVGVALLKEPPNLTSITHPRSLCFLFARSVGWL